MVLEPQLVNEPAGPAARMAEILVIGVLVVLP